MRCQPPTSQCHLVEDSPRWIFGGFFRAILLRKTSTVKQEKSTKKSTIFKGTFDQNPLRENSTLKELERPCASREGASMLSRREGGFLRREGGLLRREGGFPD